MNKKELLDKIKQLEGLNSDEKAYLLNLVNTKKKYGLVWEDKPEDVEEELRTKLPVLREVKEKAIINGDEHPNHILIEGDNLHALNALTFTHEGKIDVIYIDPPYNTGNKDFKYNDSFVDKEDSYRHSKWLSFIDKRLRIAKRLLSDKGVIFISIDDNEQAQLKLLCDSIFGEINSIGPIIQNKQNSKNDTINVQKNHEFIIIYRKAILYNEKNKVIPSLTNVDSKNKPVFEEDGMYYYINDSITTRGEGGILNKRQNLGHSIYYNPENKDIIAVCDYDIELAKTSNDFDEIYTTDETLISKGYVAIRPPKVRGKLGCWTWSLEKINNEKNNLIVTGKKGSYAIKKRTFVAKSDVFEIDNKLFYSSNAESNSRSIIDYSTNDGTETLNEVLGEFGKFNNPKNLEMLKYLLGLYSNNNILILDFFAGSGTTLHATMALNTEDGGNRHCILVTNNENNICDEVTYERNKRIIQGYTNSKGTPVEGLENNNLRYYQCDFVDRKPTLSNKRKLTTLATELLCIKEDTYKEVTSLLEKADWHKLFTDGKGKYVYIVYDDLYIDDAVELLEEFISEHQPEEKVKVYVFSNGQYAYTEEFESLAEKVELAALPDAIYKALAQVLPKENRENIPELEDELSEDQAAN
ncbi:site-specific DNA-methyltransferase [Shivajiella indica]|uniref:site-specific DNA-methyltransferase (adenine-specific) n=1 Tax=Shivajiella indica TaxID=872115 RepID=A0ABW5BBD8_9BACT